MSFIKFQNVSFSYENNVILDNISFEINQGESLCLIGSNGAGKSTLLQLMTGLLGNYTGSITIENMPVVKKNYNKIRTLLGFVFQDFDSQLFMPTVKQDIAFGLENFGFDNIDQRVNDIAKMLNITDILNKPAFKLSGGEKKLASLGTILAIEPKCILLDEPTTGLDPRNRKVLINIIKNLDKTKIITTHDLDMAMEICQRVIVLSNGKIVADGSPHDILLNEDIMLNNGLELPLGKYWIQNKLTALIYGLINKPSDLSFRFTIQNKLTALICGLINKPSDLSFRFTIQNKLTALICGLISKPSDLSFRFTI